MIISRAPVRITLGGGGTDLASYYSKYEGALIAAAIDKYTFVTAHPRFEKDIRLKYSEMEHVKKVGDIEHNIFREALKLLDIKPGSSMRLFAMGSCGKRDNCLYCVYSILPKSKPTASTEQRQSGVEALLRGSYAVLVS